MDRKRPTFAINCKSKRTQTTMPSAPSNESHFGLLHGSPLKGSHPLRSSPPHLLPLPEASTGPMEPHDPPHEVPDPSPPPSYDPAVQTLALPTAPHPVPSSKGKMEMVRDAVGRWGKRIGEAAKATGDAAGDVWQHLKTAPTVADAAMGIIAQSTKVIAEGGYEKIFRSTFDTLPDEQLKDCFACYLSTSAGPILGILYLSSAKVAFCSDNALSYKVGGRTEWSYYKVVIPLHQLQAVNPSTSKINPAEKYIQVVSIDNHEFWFMSFLNYDGAVKSLLEAPLVGNIEP